MAYLEEHRPHLTQFRRRTAKATGLVVIHTAESILDTIGPDTGAESVARFMVSRTNYGSYHDLVDSDSALQLVPYDCAAFQDGTGSNHVALSISFACRTSDWSRMSSEKRAAFLHQGAVAFHRQQAWLRDNKRPTTPLRRITRLQSEAGVAGFISHAERDPARRTDPGADFPWDEFFTACSQDAETPLEPDLPAELTGENMRPFIITNGPDKQFAVYVPHRNVFVAVSDDEMTLVRWKFFDGKPPIPITSAQQQAILKIGAR